MAKPYGQPVSECPKCDTAIGGEHPYTWCIECGEHFSPEFQELLRKSGVPGVAIVVREPSSSEARASASAPFQACIGCGESDGVDSHYYQFTYAPAWIFLFVFLCGPLPTLLLYRMMRGSNEVLAPFCDRCWNKTRAAAFVWPTLGVLTIAFIVIGLYFSAVYKTDDPIGYLMIASVVLTLPAFVINYMLRPKVALANAETVKVDVPGHGTVTLVDTPKGNFIGLGLGS